MRAKPPQYEQKAPLGSEFGLGFLGRQDKTSSLQYHERATKRRAIEGSGKKKKKSRTDSLEHQRTRSTHRKDTTTCAGRNRAPSVTTFILPLLCQTRDVVDKEEEVIRKHTRESFFALSIEAAALGVTYRSDVDNCSRNEGNQ